MVTVMVLLNHMVLTYVVMIMMVVTVLMQNVKTQVIGIALLQV